MKTEELIEKFSKAAGIESVPAVEGVWKFSADGHVFGVTDDETGGNIWLFGEIPLADPGKKDVLVKAAMEANYFHRGTGGATFSLNPETGALTLAISEKLDSLDEAAFFALVEKFVNALEVWKGLSEAGDASKEKESVPPPDGSSAPPGFGLRV